MKPLWYQLDWCYRGFSCEKVSQLVSAIGATAAFTAALTGGITAVHQYSENAASADTVTGFNEFQNRIAQAKAAAADNSDHCKIHTGAFDELSYTPEPGESAHANDSSRGGSGSHGICNSAAARWSCSPSRSRIRSSPQAPHN